MQSVNRLVKIQVLVKPFAAIILILGVFGIGSGTLGFVHELQHRAEDARVDAMRKAGGLPPVRHEHDDADCDVCAQLHMISFLQAGWTPLLILLGLFVAFLTLLDTRLIARLAPARIDCRGPPTVHSCF